MKLWRNYYKIICIVYMHLTETNFFAIIVYTIQFVITLCAVVEKKSTKMKNGWQNTLWNAHFSLLIITIAFVVMFHDSWRLRETAKQDLALLSSVVKVLEFLVLKMSSKISYVWISILKGFLSCKTFFFQSCKILCKILLNKWFSNLIS